jgi:peptide/nickel transport system ATP-binding protein
MTTQKDPILSVRGLKVAFGDLGRVLPAVRGIDLDVWPGEVLGIVGESGSGKSVASLAIAGLLPPAAKVEGSIRLNGREMVGADPAMVREVCGRDVGVIFQDPTTTLNPVMAVGRQIVEGEVARGRLPKSAATAKAVELLREVEIADPEGRAGQYPHQFSGGMRQRAVIAMAMAGRPKLIIADEPTTALDVTVQAQVLGLLARRQRETGAAVIMITHDLGVVAQIADRVAVMYAGRIVETGSVAGIFANPRHPYTAALLKSAPRLEMDGNRLDPIPGQPPAPASLPPGCPFAPRCAVARARAICTAEEPALAPLAEGGHASACHFAAEVGLEIRSHAAPAPLRRTAPDRPLLEVDDLQVHFPIRSKILRRTVGHVRAVDGVSFVVRPGETLGLVGESGCGKTTTGRAIMGLIPATGGAIRFDGTPIRGISRLAMRPVRREMQYVFQDPFASLNPIKPVGEIVAEPLRIHGLFDEMGGRGWIDRLFGMVGLSADMAGRLPREFSGGQKQRIGIARALALKPRLLILDEPVAALDVSIQAQIVNLLQDLQAELGLAYLFIAHDLSVVKQISDRVAVMYLGRIVEESDKRTLFRTPVHPYTQALLSAVPEADPAARRRKGRIVLQGEIPNPARPPAGCHFHPRCFRADARCATQAPIPGLHEGLPTRRACHNAGAIA